MNHAGPQDDHRAIPLDESIEELYEQAPCGYLTTTIDGRIVKVNRTFLEWLGYQSEEVLDKKRFVDLLTVGGRMYFETHFNLLIRMRMSVDEIALDVICKDGRILPTLINARQKRDAAGEPVLNRFTVFNATERRVYERDLLAARDLLQITLASIGDGVVATDAKGRINFMNREAERLSGWNEDAARGQPIEDILVLRREDNFEKIENPVQHALRVGQVVGLANHTVLVSREGHIYTVDDCASPMRDQNGNVVGAVLVFRDVTERRNEQRALAEATALAEQMVVELGRSNEDLGHFAAVASHDLRSPLNTVMQYAQLIERRYADEIGEGKELLRMLTAAAKRMADLIEDLLRYARINSDVSLPSAPVDANEPLQRALQNLQFSIDKSAATVTRDRLPMVFLQATHLTQIFQNLIGNAIHYRGTEPPRIHIGVKAQNDEWIFSCVDNGTGVAPAYHLQIFEPFIRLHGASHSGSGIGLAICKKIIDRFGGRIWVESAEGQGSTFYFTLPKVRKAAGVPS